MSDTQTIRLGISSCLLGENVRYDGNHKLDRYLRDIVGPFVTWVPVCPEVDCGMTVPREAMRLVGDPARPRLVTRSTGIDLTDQMETWAMRRVRELEKEDLCGYVFKSKSPSSGMAGVKVYSEKGHPAKKGSGIFARIFMDHFPLLPVEDEGRLNDAGLRENFLERVFVFARWRALLEAGGSLGALVDFHACHKLLVMGHSPKHLRLLGRIVAEGKGRKKAELHADYLSTLTDALKLKATVPKNTNVLQHVMGYFKKDLSPDEKQELLEVIERYRRGLVPLVVPVTLLNHYVRKFDEPYLKGQVFLDPHPAELMLRNHV